MVESILSPPAVHRRHPRARVKSRTQREGSRREGFTLIEILVVMFILGILAALVVAGVSGIQKKGQISTCSMMISNLHNALQNYLTDEKLYPGNDPKTYVKNIGPEDNLFPLLFNALFGERRPRGPGGRSAPYLQLDRDKVAVKDEEHGGFRPATDEEIDDPKVEKYLMDPWGNPIIYRPNKGRPPQPWMKNKNGADIYSLGPDGVDQTILGEKGDDIGNW